MDLPAALTEIESLSVEDRIRLVQAIWDSIAEQEPPALTAAQRNELDRRLAAHTAAPDDVLTWDEIKDRVRGRQ